MWHALFSFCPVLSFGVTLFIMVGPPFSLQSRVNTPPVSGLIRRFFLSFDWSFGGHSLRAGGATYFASLGLSEDVIQALGRWSSQAWKVYIHDNPTVRAELQLSSLRRSSSSHLLA